ncbi:MAG: thiolase family protein [Actinobacteria bacterium]|nr:thiolase family protein [Actinomycetota bacterium]
MRDVLVVDAVRTPTGVRNGSLSGLRPDENLASALNHLVSERLRIDPASVEDLVCGCVTQIGEQALNIARNALLASGLPASIAGVTVNRQEGSGQAAMAFAAQAIAAGEMDVAIACGVESMSRQPMGSDGFGDHVAHLGTGISPRLCDSFGDLYSQGMAAERLASSWGFSREELDGYALRSHERASAAIACGFYDNEIVPAEVTAAGGRTMLLRHDEGVRSDLTLQELSTLAPAFKPGGVITNGNSGQAADGAAAVFLAAAERCSELGLAPKARYVCTAVSGEDPSLAPGGHISATRRALRKAGLRMEDIDLFEVNESFAAVPMAWMRELEPPRPESVNAWGGAVANGNPLGASGVKLACTLISGLAEKGGRYGLLATCTGMGMGIATILERTQ